MKPTSPYIRDVQPPAASNNPPAAAVTDPQVKTELVRDIPVKSQDGAAPAGNPISQPVPLPVHEQPEADKEFDQVLKDVNREVKKQSPEADGKKSRLGFKKTDRQSGPQAAKPRSNKLPITLAVVVAVVLVFAALTAFKKSGGA